MSQCPNCNTEVGVGQKFCFECGTKIPQEKSCPQCETVLPVAVKFCGECGFNFNAAAPAVGLSMGDKNVVAGDVIGQKVAGDNVSSKVMGNVIHNTIKDDTKSVNTCSVCGAHMRNDTGHTCPKCGNIVCEDHFDEEFLCCSKCAKPLQALKTEEREKALGASTFTDPRDGQVYKTVKIGDQVWFAENFRYKCKGSYVDPIQRDTKKYGRLYTWDAACWEAPEGWHLPVKDEWDKLQAFVEANASAEVGTALKSEEWIDFDDNAGTDEFGFCALPVGTVDPNGVSDFDYGSASFWTNTDQYIRRLTVCDGNFYEDSCAPDYALSVRYIKD